MILGQPNNILYSSTKQLVNLFGKSIPDICEQIPEKNFSTRNSWQKKEIFYLNLLNKMKVRNLIGDFNLTSNEKLEIATQMIEYNPELSKSLRILRISNFFDFIQPDIILNFILKINKYFI